MKVIVDTNIAFSAILNSSSNIGRILIASGSRLQFYSCQFLIDEIQSHQQKLKVLTRLSTSELKELEDLVLGKISFINDELISVAAWNKSKKVNRCHRPKRLPLCGTDHSVEGRTLDG